jgi:hypothetical protein
MRARSKTRSNRVNILAIKRENWYILPMQDKCSGIEKRRFNTASIARNYSGGGDSNYAAKLDVALDLIRKKSKE